jgi:two-component system response regulator FixJ
MLHHNESDAGLAPVEARAMVARLEPIERSILVGLLDGASTKLLASSLQMDLAVIENHRAIMMNKLNAGSTADAVRIALLACMDTPPGRTNRG